MARRVVTFVLRGGGAIPISVIDKKRTTTQYIFILQALDRFEANSIREVEKHRFETVLGGTLRGTATMDWYALAYDRRELEYDEALAMARVTIQRYREPDRY
jgi:hypothetical protein